VTGANLTKWMCRNGLVVDPCDVKIERPLHGQILVDSKRSIIRIPPEHRQAGRQEHISKTFNCSFGLAHEVLKAPSMASLCDHSTQWDGA
jgi:hypothetical protein